MSGVAARLIEAISARDFDSIAACFAADCEMRVLTPRQLRELAGPDAAAERFRAWFGELDGFELLDSDVERISDRVRIRWRTRGEDPEKGWQENDHTGYAEIDGDDRIVALNVSCAGFRPVPAP
jgi:hypothetical protein